MTNTTSLPILNKLIRFLQKLININKRPYYGFVQGHRHLSNEQVNKLASLVSVDCSENNDEFEREFANFLGLKNATSFASGRMGFFALLKSIGIQKGDEIILTGSTCAVMANAVLKIEATPVYADISNKTFGTCPESVKNLITKRTKVIVAQHSFGIPCEIEQIADIAISNEIFLLEDCALSFDSSVNGKLVGTFGDASLFSFDHTKPLNAMIGGIICSGSDLDRKLKLIKNECDEIPLGKRKLLFKKFKSERALCNPSRYSRLLFLELIDSKIRNIFKMQTPFLIEDSSSKIEKISSYPYPAKMPEFISCLARFELARWKVIKIEREKIAQKYLQLLTDLGFKSEIEGIYFKENQNITPLRFVWSFQEGAEFREGLKEFLHIERTWFTRPIVDTSEDLINFNYIEGSCPNSELIGRTIINLPTAISLDEAEKLIERITNEQL